MLVRGPTGTRVISCGAAWTSSMIRSGPNRASTLHLLGGSSMLARPFLPCQNSAVMSFWKSGCCAPAAMGMSQRLASETMRSAFSRPCLAVVLPATTVMARTSNSGEWSASMRAMASSVPGSVSKMIFLPEAGEAKITERKMRRRRNPMLRPGEKKLYPAARHCVEQGREYFPTALADSLSATPLQEQHAALRSRNKPPDRIARRLAFTLQKCQDKSRAEIVVRWKTFSHDCRKCRLENLLPRIAVGNSARERCYYFLQCARMKHGCEKRPRESRRLHWLLDFSSDLPEPQRRMLTAQGPRKLRRGHRPRKPARTPPTCNFGM